MAKKNLEPAPGHQFRGFIVRLYLEEGQDKWLRAQQQNMRTAWNWMVKNLGDENHKAVESYAIRNNLVPAKPERPNYDGLDPDAAKELKRAHIEAWREWRRVLSESTKKDPNCADRKFKDWIEHMGCKHDYQMLTKVLKWSYEDKKFSPVATPGAHMLQSLVKNFFQKAKGQRPKHYKKKHDEMPIQVRSGDCFLLGGYGPRGKNPSFYNCQISINGMKFRGRLPGAKPNGRVLEGVALTREADGWYASIKVEVPIRKLPEAIPGSVIGIDVGLDNIAAMSDGTIVTNDRDKVFDNKISKLQTRAALTDDDELAASLMNQSARLHQKARRHSRHVLYNKILKPLAEIETIKLEMLSSKIGQMGGSRKKSVMRLTYQLLKERYGDRVRAVECAFTSQDCSKCGFRSKESWSYANGPWGECHDCGYRDHRDLNAARNIACRPVISLDISG